MTAWLVIPGSIVFWGGDFCSEERLQSDRQVELDG